MSVVISTVPLEDEIKNNPELRMADIKTLRDWCEKQPHLPKISDKELALFMHSNYYLLEPTKVTIDTYFTIRTHVPEFFSNKDVSRDSDIKQAMTVLAYFPLQGKTREGYNIMFGKLIDSDPSRYHYNSVTKYFLMVTDYFLHTKPFASGHVLLMDMATVSFGHAARVSPLGLKKLFVYLQEGLPCRRKAVHLFNAPPAWDLIFNMIKPLIKKELLGIVHLHTTLDSLAKHIDIDILPNECGGKAGPIMPFHEETMKTIVEHSAWFTHDEKNNRVNEALRPGKGKSAADLFGIAGSFKQLDID